MDFDILSDPGLFYINDKGKEPKDVWTAFEIFETNSIDMAKIDNIFFQKSTDVFALEKRNGNSPKCFGLLFTEKNAKLNWVNRRHGD